MNARLQKLELLRHQSVGAYGEFRVYRSSLGSRPRLVGSVKSGKFTEATQGERELFSAEMARIDARVDYAVVYRAFIEKRIDEESKLLAFALDQRIQTCMDLIAGIVEDAASEFVSSGVLVMNHSAAAALVRLSENKDPVVAYLARHGIWSICPDGVANYFGVNENAPELERDLT